MADPREGVTRIRDAPPLSGLRPSRKLSRARCPTAHHSVTVGRRPDCPISASAMRPEGTPGGDRTIRANPARCSHRTGVREEVSTATRAVDTSRYRAVTRAHPAGRRGRAPSTMSPLATGVRPTRGWGAAFRVRRARPRIAGGRAPRARRPGSAPAWRAPPPRARAAGRPRPRGGAPPAAPPGPLSSRHASASGRSTRARTQHDEPACHGRPADPWVGGRVQSAASTSANRRRAVAAVSASGIRSCVTVTAAPVARCGPTATESRVPSGSRHRTFGNAASRD